MKVASADNDVAVASIVSPSAGFCANSAQFVTVGIRNLGGSDQSNGIPLTVVIKNGTSIVATLNATYSGTITAGGVVNYTLQSPFNAVAGTTYTISAYTNLSSDQNRANDTTQQSVTIATKAVTPSGTARVCGNNITLNVTNANSTANYFWYTSATGGNSFATGSNVNSNTSATNYYLSSGYRGAIGPLNKNIISGGGYNNFAGNYVNITATVPVTIDVAKLYIGYPGKINFVVADLSNVSASSYNYTVLSSTTIDAYNTTPNATAPNSAGANPDVVADSGAYYYLNLYVPAGTHAIIINPNFTTNATIFRNLNSTANIYPISVPNVMSITGNSVQAAGTANYQNYYYFFYDMHINTPDCISDIATITPTSSTAPVISLRSSDTTLLSSITNALSYQWSLNGVAITGATSATYKPTQSGTYSITVIDSYGCTLSSNTLTVTVASTSGGGNTGGTGSGGGTGGTSTNTDINIKITPNPASYKLGVSFTLTASASVSVELLDATGKTILINAYTGVTGTFNQQYAVGNITAGIYLLKVLVNDKVYIKTVMINH